MSDTAISWTHRPGTRGRSWNPVKGCSRVSGGCRHCYAERQAARVVRMRRGKATVYDDLVRTVNGEARWTGRVILDTRVLAEPLRWRDPSTVFVNSMSDLFHESLNNEQIAAVFGVMAATPQHTFQILTKRAKRMREWFAWLRNQGDPFPAGALDYLDDTATAALAGHFDCCHLNLMASCRWPLSNVWLGVSVENQAAADERIPELLATPAAVRFLSCEPLLESVDLRRVRPHPMPIDSLTGRWSVPQRDGSTQEPRIHWVIAGCESGPGARPCDVAWLRSLRDQCAQAGVPFFLKQAMAQKDHRDSWIVADRDGSHRKAGGVIELPYLDGVQHRAFPGAA